MGEDPCFYRDIEPPPKQDAWVALATAFLWQVFKDYWCECRMRMHQVATSRGWFRNPAGTIPSCWQRAGFTSTTPIFGQMALGVLLISTLASATSFCHFGTGGADDSATNHIDPGARPTFVLLWRMLASAGFEEFQLRLVWSMWTIQMVCRISAWNFVEQPTLTQVCTVAGPSWKIRSCHHRLHWL